MVDGMVVGVLIFVLGVAAGSGGVYWMMARFERERAALHQIIGRQQQELDTLVPVFPEEEM